MVSKSIIAKKKQLLFRTQIAHGYEPYGRAKWALQENLASLKWND